MGINARTYNGFIEHFDKGTHERVLVEAPVVFYDDFLGRIVNVTDVWGVLDTAGGAEAIVANAANGVYGMALDATNEAQLAGLYWSDQRPLVLNQGLVFEARAALSVLPTTAVIACIGLAGAHNAAVDTVAESIWFRADANGVITVEHDDTATETSKVATGITLTAGLFAIFRIDCTIPTDIKFFINGARVAGSTTFSGAAVPTLALQPVIRIGKEAAGTGLGTIQLDYVRIWQKRA
jgi:hypothetical protein